MTRTRGAVLAVAAVVAVAVLAFALGRGSGTSSEPAAPAQSAESTKATTPPTADAGEPAASAASLWAPITSDPAPVTMSTWESQQEWLDENAAAYPSPASSKKFPPVPGWALRAGGGYAAAFTDQVFNVDFGADDRDEFMAWVLWEAAPFKNPPGFHATEAENALYSASQLTDPPNSQLPLVPEAQEWDRLAELGVKQQVRNVAVLPDPGWQEMLLEGPPETHTGDPNSDCVAITATVDRTAGAATETKDLYFRVCMGTAMNHDGLGFSSAGQVTQR